MPHSLRAKLSGLRYKQIISDKDYDRLCKALDNEGVLDKIKAEIESIERYGSVNGHDVWLRTPEEIKKEVFKIIDKYKAESEVTE